MFESMQSEHIEAEAYINCSIPQKLGYFLIYSSILTVYLHANTYYALKLQLSKLVIIYNNITKNIKITFSFGSMYLLF